MYVPWLYRQQPMRCLLQQQAAWQRAYCPLQAGDGETGVEFDSGVVITDDPYDEIIIAATLSSCK